MLSRALQRAARASRPSLLPSPVRCLTSDASQAAHAAEAKAAAPSIRQQTTRTTEEAAAAKKEKQDKKKRAEPAAAPDATAAAAAAVPAAASASAAAAKPAAARRVSAGSALWGPASGGLPLDAYLSKPRVHRPPTHAADGSPLPPPVPLRVARLPHDEPDSHQVQLDIFAAVVVERWPKVLRDEAPFKAQYAKHFASVRARKQQQHAIPAELQYSEADEVDDNGRRKAQAFSESVVVTPESLLTEADVVNDLHATHRALQDSLFLLVKRRGGGATSGWTFPTAQVPFDILKSEKEAALDAKTIQAALLKDASPAAQAAAAIALAQVKEAARKEKVSLRSVGSQAISSTVGTHAGVYFMGNAPIAVYRSFNAAQSGEQKAIAAHESRKAYAAALKTALETGSAKPEWTEPAAPTVVGSKTFYMHALYMDGEIRLQNSREYEDYAWVKKTELAKYIGEGPAAVLQKVLLDPKP